MYSIYVGILHFHFFSKVIWKFKKNTQLFVAKNQYLEIGLEKVCANVF